MTGRNRARPLSISAAKLSLRTSMPTTTPLTRLNVVEPETIARFTEYLNKSGQPSIVDDALAGSGGVEIRDVDDARELRVLAGHTPDRIGKVLPQARRLLGDIRPAGNLGHVEPDKLMVLLDELGGSRLVAEVVREMAHFVREHIREPLQKDERQNVIFELRRVERPANLTSCVPEPAFKGRYGKSWFFHHPTLQYRAILRTTTPSVLSLRWNRRYPRPIDNLV